MKQSNTTRGLLAASMALLLLWSCADDPIARKSQESDNIMRFESSIYAGDNTKSRTNSNCLYTDFKAEKFDDREMYLVSGVQEGIDASKLISNDSVVSALNAAKADPTAPMSRATGLTTASLYSTYLQNSGWYISLYGFKYAAQTTYNSKSLTAYNFSDVLSDSNVGTIEKIIDAAQLSYVSTESDNTLSLQCNGVYRWDTGTGNRISFFGLFPHKNLHRADAGTYTISTADNRLSIYYQIDEVKNQVDLLCGQVSYAGNGVSNNYKVSIALKHILAGVNISLGTGFDADDVIKSVSFTGVGVAGTYDAAAETWSSPSATGTRTLSLSDSEGTAATSSDNNTLFLMMPQTLPSAATLTIVTRNTGTGVEETFTKTISGEWTMGNTITYQLSRDPDLTEYYLETEYDNMYYSWNGTAAGLGTSESRTSGSVTKTVSDLGKIRVKSYKAVTKIRNGSEASTGYAELGWTAQMYDGNNSAIANGSNGVSYPTASSSTYHIDSSADDAYDLETYTSGTSRYNARFNSRPYNYQFNVNIGAQTQTEVYPDEYTAVTSNSSKELYDKSSPSVTGQLYMDLTKYKQVYTKSGTSLTLTTWKTTNGGSTSNRLSSNCYMICYPGYYCFPCVWGNGYYNNATQSDTYSLGTSGYAVNTLKASDNNNIPGLWMNAGFSGMQPYTAELLWQDAKGLISEVKVLRKDGSAGNSSTNYNGESYLCFTIPSGDTFKPGNAVIAVKNPSGTIIWSWHIWVTNLADYSSSSYFTADPTSTSNGTILVGSERRYLKRPLGYVKEPTKAYAARAYTLVISQEGSTKTKTVNLKQNRHELPNQSCCYYQWGRKDPFPGVHVVENSGTMTYYGEYLDQTIEQRPCYNISGSTVKYQSQSVPTSTLGGGIQNPMLFYTKFESDGTYTNRFPATVNYYDLWGCLTAETSYDNSNTKLDRTVSNRVVASTSIGLSSRKTCYDPCPPGYKVPPVYCMPAITYDGLNIASGASVWVKQARTEDIVYNQMVNTPYTSHDQYVDGTSYEFYRSRMSGLNSKNTGSGTYELPALGEIGNDGKYVGYGQYSRFWTATAWASSNGVYNHAMFSLRVGYADGVSEFSPSIGNTESYGCPILAMFDDYGSSTRPVY